MAKKQISTYKFVPGNVVPDVSLYPNAYALLDANKKFIQEEALAYISYNVANNIEPFVFYTYNREKCRRDISYILEGYLTDLRHGGNRQTVNNAAKYFENGVPQVDGDRTPEIAAHTFISNLIQNYILTNVSFGNRQSIIAQYKSVSTVAETAGKTKLSTLASIIINVITNGLSSLPAVDSNRGYVKFPGFYKLKDILLITNTSRNVILYNFADDTYQADLTYSENYDSDFPGALYGAERITTITFDIDTSNMMVTDQIQIFVEGKEQLVRLNPIGTDAMERQKVGIPQSMLDADFEYGLQPTKWQAIALMRNYPAIYEIPGSDIPVISVTTDASSGTSGFGASLITVTTQSAHGLTVGSAITIKALANSISGFSRAEGSFLISAVDTSTTLAYYAKSKVGTNNGDLLSSTYTQLRKGSYYTGAAISNPSFNVYSNGSSGTITTSLITAAGRDIIGFSGSAPPIGSPLSGTGVVSGAQVTAVTGSGGTSASTTLATLGSIGDTVITVTSTTGITPGLVFDRGDGYAVTVTDVTNNDVTLSGALTSTIIGTTQSYTGATQTATSGNGTGAVFTVSRNGGSYSATATTPGTSYVANDTITIPGASVGGTTPTNNVTLTVTAASGRNTVVSFNLATLIGGSGYTKADNVSTTSSGSGTGLSVDISEDGTGFINAIVVNNPGSGYAIGETITIGGGNGDATVQVFAINPGGFIQTVSGAGTPITAPTKNFISAFTISEVTSSVIGTGNTGITYSAIGTIEVTFPTPHGFIPGNTITVAISSSGTNAQLAAGPFFVEQVPTSTTLRYTARAAGSIVNTLSGIVYARPDGFFVHRPFDGGVQLGTAGSAHGSTAIRMSKKYIRYQSGKGVMYNTGALFAPSYDIRSLSANGTAVGSIITLTTDDTDHGCQVGAVITINGVTTAGYNGQYTVSDISTERVLSVIATQTLGSTNAVLSGQSQMSVRNWHGSTIRAGIFDDQNGMFWQYDGIKMAVVRRSSTFQIAGTISIAANSNSITGSNTRFTQQLAAGDRVVIRGMSHVVSQILSDTTMSVTPDYRGVADVTNVKLCKTVDIVIPQEYWNVDPLNGSGPTGYNLDVTKMQMIGIQHTWYGAGFIDFMLRGPDGNYAFAHRFRNSNVNTEAYMRTGNQPVRYEVINEGAKGKTRASMDSSQTTIPLNDGDAYWFPTSGTVIIDAELIRFTGNDGSNLTGCSRAASLTQFSAGSQRNFSGGVAASHAASTGVILVSNTVTPNISHWGSAFLIDGQFDSDRGYIFNYAATGTSVSVDKKTAFLIRLAPSVSNAQIGDLGEKELLNRAQLLLSSISVTSDSVSGGGALVVEGVLNPQNYPTDPTLITWTGLSSSAAGGQPSFAQIASGGSVTWGGNASTQTATVQGAFTTTLTAKSFTAATTNLTATSFNAISQTLSLPAITAAQNATYQFAFDPARTDILITQASYAALTTSIVAGDTLTMPGGGTLATVQIVGTAGQFTCAANTLYVGMTVTISGTSGATYPASGSISGYTNPTTYYIITTNGSTSFTLSATRGGGAITTAVGTPTGLTYTTATFIQGGRTVVSVTASYITINLIPYARIVLNAAPGLQSPTNTAYATPALASSLAATYGAALSTARTDFLIPNAQNSGIAVTDVLSLATYVTSGQTISSITGNYCTISGTAYARIQMSAAANATGTAGAGNNLTVVSTSAATATYGRALSTARTDFLITDAAYDASGIATSDGLSMATNITGGQTITAVTRSYITINSVSHTRIVMSAVANGSTTAGAGNDATVTVTAAGTAASYQNTNYLFFTSSSWINSGATVGTKVASDQTQFAAGTSVAQIATRTFSSTTVYRVTFTQSSNTTINAAATLKFQFGAFYALPGEQVFSFVSNPGNTDTLDLQPLKELTATAIGGRGAFPNGPDVLAINVYKVAGSATPANLILRWGEAQA